MASNAESGVTPQRQLGAPLAAQQHPLYDIEIPDFHPAAFLRCRHRQTLASVYLPGVKFIYQAVRHLVSLPDGDQLVLHDDCPNGWSDGDRAVLLIHGLVGCHGSPYQMRISGKLWPTGSPRIPSGSERQRRKYGSISGCRARR